MPDNLTPEEAALIEARRAAAPTVIDEDGQLEATEVKTSASTAITLPKPDAAFDVALVDEKWDYETAEFFGDTLHIRVPTMQAVSGLQLVGGKHTPETVKANIFGLFIKNHLSPASYTRLFERLIDPNDPSYTAQAVGELMGTLVERAAELINAEDQA
ncbi:gp26 [Rhodococcus phage ReqiPine5]|uniref:Gp26 n=1 Tax=Rhodococcus phage ReqiPine5 TaxID=691963 RepID=D4P801_9CAUD|nr:gp26 [Rhodococcus phage ReqiPine5]ADD81131.1 gp26 [Rhodococcus phage ReqiPine5]